MGWLRGAVSRFASGEEHARRRALVVSELGAIPVRPLRDQATAAVLGGVAPAAAPAHVLASAVGVPAAGLEEAVAAVAAIAPSYLEGADAAARPAADRAVRSLMALLRSGPSPLRSAAPTTLRRDPSPLRLDPSSLRLDPTTLCPADASLVAARIAILVQAHAATAALIVRALAAVRELRSWPPLDALLDETLRLHAPVPGTRRVALEGATLGGRAVPAGTVVALDFAAANRDPLVFDDPDRFDPSRAPSAHVTFGAGPRSCPGAAHALALAAGVLEAQRRFE
jgi:cytochrome P450